MNYESDQVVRKKDRLFKVSVVSAVALMAAGAGGVYAVSPDFSSDPNPVKLSLNIKARAGEPFLEKQGNTIKIPQNSTFLAVCEAQGASVKHVTLNIDHETIVTNDLKITELVDTRNLRNQSYRLTCSAETEQTTFSKTANIAITTKQLELTGH